MKEPGHEVLKNNGYDLKVYKRNHESALKFRTTDSWNKVPTFIEFILFASRYCKDKGIDSRDITVNELFDRMLPEGICIIHLYKRQEDLERAWHVFNSRKNFLE